MVEDLVYPASSNSNKNTVYSIATRKEITPTL
jgi:hypothetical protein